MSNEIVVGLDIGTTKIACIVGQATDNGKIKILGFGKCKSIGVERGVVKNVIDTSDSIRKAVDEASEMSGFDITEVYVGIAGQHISSMQNKGSIVLNPPHKIIDEEDINRLINEQENIVLKPGEEIIHILPQVFYADGEELTVNPIGVEANRLEATFHIVTGQSDNLRRIRTSVEAAGLKVKDVVLEPIASAESVLDAQDKEAGVALIDIGGGTTDIAIFENGIIRHTAVFSIAGDLITEDIRSACTILKHQAEQLKTKFGSCLPEMVSADDIITIPGMRSQAPREISMKNLASIIKARTELILGLAYQEIETTGYLKKLIGGIVLTGGGSNLRHMKDFSEFTTGIETRIGLPNEHLSTDSPEELTDPIYATGIGLLITGLNNLKAQKAAELREQAKKASTEPKHTETNIAEEIEEPAIDTNNATDSNEDSTQKPSNSKLGPFVASVRDWMTKIFNENEES